MSKELEEKMASRFRELYDNVVRGELQKKFAYKNPMQVPKVEKIIINMGVGEATGDSKVISAAVADMTAISGRKPVVIRAKRSVSTFKLREGMPIGCKVTLRREQMYDFLDRLITIALPRVREDRKSTRPNSSHVVISYAVFCLKKKSTTSLHDFVTHDLLILSHDTFATIL